MKYASLVFKNLFRSGRRTTLTIFSIAVSLFIFSALVSLPTVANQLLADSGSSVRIACRSKMGLSYPLPEAYKNKIAATRHVVAVVPEKVFFGLYHDVTDQFPNIAVEPDQIELMWPDWGISPQSAEQFRKVRRGALVSPDTLKRFNLHLGQQIQLHGTLYPFNVTLTLVGTIDSAPVPYLLLFRRDYLEEAAGRPGTVDNFWVRVDSAQAVPQVIAALDEKFANSSAETQSESEGAFLAGILNNYRIFFRLADGMDPRPLIHGLVMGPGCAEQHPNKARRVRDGNYNDRDRLGKECVRGVRCG